ncbi:MAG: TonB-dependent receptor [Desulfobacteraceae bacterium]|nr:TonB-dependent receptor [Desulfobacteraceae bacterium]
MYFLFFRNIGHARGRSESTAPLLWKNMGRLVAVSFFLMLVAPMPGWAQPEAPSSTEEIFFREVPSVYGASKFEQKVSEAPSSVSIVTQSDIKKFGYRNLSDILRSVRGFFTTYDRNYSYIGARGFGRPGDYNTRVLLMVDGHRINDGIYDQASIGNEFPVDVDLIDKVEVIRGPSSSIYGTNAFFGVINIVTRRGRDLKGAEMSAEAGRFDTYGGRASYGDRYSNGIEFLVSGTYSNSPGGDRYYKEFDHPSTNRGIASGCDWEEYYKLFSKATMRDFTVQTLFSSRDKGIPTAPWGAWFNQSNTATTDQRGYFDLSYERSFSNDLSLNSRVYYDHYQYRGIYAYNRAASGEPLSLYDLRDFGKSDWWGGDVQITKMLFRNHKLLVGGEFKDIFRQDQGVYQRDPNSVVLDSRKSSFNGAVFIEDQYRIFKNLILNAGARYDYYDTFGNTLNPRVALIYNPFEKTSLKLIYGEAFRAPNAYELYYMDGFTTKAPRDLQPEKIQTYEAVWEQYLGDRHKMTTALYHYSIDDLISLQIDPADNLLVFRNMGRAKATGVEWEFETKWKGGIESRISYAFQEARDDATESLLTNSPQHQAKLNLLFPLIRDKAFLGTEFHYVSPRKTIAGRNSDNVVLTNITLYTQKFMKGLEVSASIYNLFDQKYGDPGSDEHLQDLIEQDGINFRVKVTYSF